jgi:hypothetical protein
MWYEGMGHAGGGEDEGLHRQQPDELQPDQQRAPAEPLAPARSSH